MGVLWWYEITRYVGPIHIQSSWRSHSYWGYIEPDNPTWPTVAAIFHHPGGLIIGGIVGHGNRLWPQHRNKWHNDTIRRRVTTQTSRWNSDDQHEICNNMVPAWSEGLGHYGTQIIIPGPRGSLMESVKIVNPQTGLHQTHDKRHRNVKMVHGGN